MTLERRPSPASAARRRVTPRIQVRPAATDGSPAGPPRPLLPHFERPQRQVEVTRPRNPARRGRHVAPQPPQPALGHHSRRQGLALTGLVAFIVLGLTLLPLTRHLGQGGVWPRLLLAAVMLVGAPGLVALAVSRRAALGNWLTAAGSLWTLGLVTATVGYLAGRPVLGPSHLAWAAATVLLLIAARLSWSGGRERPHAMSMLVLDAGLIACSWLAMIWRQFFWGGQVSFIATDWLVLAAIGLDLFLLSLLLMLVSEAVDRGVIAATVSLVFVTASDVVGALWAESTTGVSAGAALLLAAAWSTSVYATVYATVRARRAKRPGRSAATTDGWRGLVTLAAVLIPMGMTFGGLAATLEVDRTTLLLAGAVVVLFGVRELMRSRQAQGLVDLLADQALHDPLTGLGNRRALAERLIEMSSLTTPVTVLTLDVDRFKLVNTEFGHMIGDDVLAAVGLALKETTTPVGARAFRLGGDEFAVLAVGDNEIGLMLADRVRAAVLRRTNEVPGVANLALTASVGVAPLDRGSADPLAVLGRSAEALRVAKQERNRVRLYTEDLANQNVRRVQMEQRLRRAIDDDAMVFHYQPIVDLRSGRIMGLEALARWEDPELGFVSPADFVPIAEQTGLIHDLGRMAIESALRVMVDGAVAVSPVGYVAVNVSPLQLRRPQFVQEVSDMVIDLRATPSMLKLEVTEGIFMDTDDPAVENLRRLADLGIGIAIDDFGSGYSSLGYMSRLPVETVKVDRLLTSQVDDARTRSVVKALVWVAEAHGLQVILEGVENEQTAATLRRLGVRWGQGWLFSRAVPEADLPEVLDLLGTVPISHRFAHSNLARLTSPRRQQARIG